MIPEISPITGLPPVQATKPEVKKPNGFGFSFDNLLDIVNPLQHIPVVGTLYRAITGDKIAAPEKIAGGALFGGLWGLVSSVADAAFEAITGKDFGSTVLALFTGDGDRKTVTARQSLPAASAQAVDSPPDVSALITALSSKGVDSDIARRATYAYNKSMNMAAEAALR